MSFFSRGARLPEDPLSRLKAAEELSAEERRDLVAALSDERPARRRAALDVLGHRGELRGEAAPAGVIERAVELARDPHPLVRAEACASLVLLRPEALASAERRAALLGATTDPSPLVRQEACAALGDLGPEAGAEGRARLHARLGEDEEEGVRFEAALALARLGAPEARPVLERSLRDRRRRLDALQALGRLGDAAAVPALRRVLAVPWVAWVDRLGALAALARIGDPAASGQLVERLSARRFEERIHAVALVAELGLSEALPTLRALARSRDAARAAALDALAALGGRAELEWLSGLEDPEARAAAAALRERL